MEVLKAILQTSSHTQIRRFSPRSLKFVSQLSILLAWNFMICSANWQCKKLSRILRWRLHVPLPIVDNNGVSPQHQPMQESSCKRDLSRQSRTKYAMRPWMQFATDISHSDRHRFQSCHGCLRTQPHATLCSSSLAEPGAWLVSFHSQIGTIPGSPR